MFCIAVYKEVYIVYNNLDMLNEEVKPHNDFDIKTSALGRDSHYVGNYSPELLFSIPRSIKRNEIVLSLGREIIFYGCDIWNAYEVSWLNAKGKPEVRIAQISYDARSEYMVESKSLKLYLNSFNNTNFDDQHAVIRIIIKDLTRLLKTEVLCQFYDLASDHYNICSQNGWILLDNLDVAIDYNSCHQYKPLIHKNQIVEEKLYTNLLKSNCLVTNQPDFGSLFIDYKGSKIDHYTLLQYIISLRNIHEFHEQCVERIYAEILTKCRPSKLIVCARYTRRGGIDINPIRSSDMDFISTNARTLRQ